MKNKKIMLFFLIIMMLIITSCGFYTCDKSYEKEIDGKTVTCNSADRFNCGLNLYGCSGGEAEKYECVQEVRVKESCA